MRLLPRFCLLLLAVGLCASAATSATATTRVYQWRDAKGVIHSADKPPPGQKYETRRIDNRGQTVDESPAEQAPLNPQCITARQNLSLLSSGVEVQQDTDGDGKPDAALGADERAAQKQLAEAAVKAYCPPAN